MRASTRGALAERFWQWRLKLAGRELKEPGCGVCGYPVQGLAGTVCPECGADQRDVGIAEPVGPLPRWVGTSGWCAAWVVFVVLLAVLLNPTLLKGVPRKMSNHRDYFLQPRSKAFDSIDVRRIGYGFGSPWLPHAPDKSQRGWIILRVGQWGGFHHIDFDRERGTYSTAGGNGKLNHASLLAFFARGGADTSRADVQAEAAELLALINKPDFSSPEPGLNQFVPLMWTRGGPEWVPKEQGQLFLGLAWLLLIGGGCWLVVRWRRRQAPVRGFLLDAPDAA